jgi:hypothetical protein
MSSPSETSFVPKDNVPHTFGHTTVCLYLEVDMAMSYSERFYAFMVSKSALEAAGIPHNQMLQILAGITCTAPKKVILSLLKMPQIRTDVHQTSCMQNCLATFCSSQLSRQTHPPIPSLSLCDCLLKTGLFKTHKLAM